MTRLVVFLISLSILGGCAAQADTQELAAPLPRVSERPTPLHFGLYVTPDPAQNPIDPPERFTGYHTATDFEVFPEERDVEVPVSAVCPGEVVFSGSAEGYGGVLVHRCRIARQAVTVLYGHLDPRSLPTRGAHVDAGQRIGILASHNSAASGGNRKHLHLGIHKGKAVELRGYAQDAASLADWIDPLTLLRK